MIERERPLVARRRAGAARARPLEIGGRELELHAAQGHTGDGMAVMIGWAGVLLAGDYLSAVELPSLGEGGSAPEYLATLDRLRPLVAPRRACGPRPRPVLDRDRALQVLEQDVAYLGALIERGARRGPARGPAHAGAAQAARGERRPGSRRGRRS